MAAFTVSRYQKQSHHQLNNLRCCWSKCEVWIARAWTYTWHCGL